MISLDFELMWGMRDKFSLQACAAAIEGVHEALPKMLDSFGNHGVRATFATVGLLFFDTKAQLLAGLPTIKPTYSDQRFSLYNGYLETIGEDVLQDKYHFGSKLVRLIQSHPEHEIGCHTFSHYYCMEEGQTKEQFEADLVAAKASAAAMGIQLQSFVFPANQCNPAYLSICRAHGIRAFRGTGNSWLQEPRPYVKETLLRRGLRLVDAWVNISGHHCHPYPVPREGQPVDIPASRFLRPWSKHWAAFDGLRLHRITKAMDHAAHTGTIFHLWWHPHNFGLNIGKNLAFLDRVLDHYNSLRDRHGMENHTMGELAGMVYADDR